MNDPILAKIFSDARIVLRDVWRAICHQSTVDQEEIAPRTLRTSAEEPSHSGLCYFHLN